MKTRPLAILCLMAAVSTLLFFLLLLADVAAAGPLDTFEQVLAHVSHQSLLFRLAYANMTILTIIITMLMAALYHYCRQYTSLWPVMAVVFVPVYCLLNVFAYLSQITVVPRLLDLYEISASRAAVEMLLRQVLQLWPDSAVAIFNNTAYGILGIPSIIYGIILFRMQPRVRLGAVLLVLNGVACMAGVVGFVARNDTLSQGSMVGAALFLLSLVVMTYQFFSLDSKQSVSNDFSKEGNL